MINTIVKRAAEENSTRLDLSRLGLASIPTKVFELTGLHELNLSHNRLSHLPAEISRLKNLRILELASNQVATLPKEVGSLQNLRILDLSSNRLRGLPTSLGRLGSLNTLSLHSNIIQELPKSLAKLSLLVDLYLHHNLLTTFPSSVLGLHSLAHLNLSSNRIETLPPQIDKLTQLRDLELRANRLRMLPPQIGGLTSLSRLNLAGNDLQFLPPELQDCPNLRKLFLNGNPGLRIPPEILGTDNLLLNRSNPGQILGYYFRAQAESTQPLREAKILIVGQGDVGKTSLLRRLTTNRYDPDEPATPGINIIKWQVTPSNDKVEIKVNIWDFGGQEIMHATHEFFLTKRSLYILVLDARKRENESNLYYWLRIIQHYGGDAPVLVAINKSEPPHFLSLNEPRLTKDYAPNIKGFMSISCRTGDGIDRLKEEVTQQIAELKHVYNLVPTSYLQVKKTLESHTESRDFITIQDYQVLCESNSINKKSDQLVLLRFLHDLGAVLHFADPDSPFPLEETKILNPQWVTAGVYKLLNNSYLMKQGGVLTLRILSKILPSSAGYPRSARLFILGIMRKFELCFEFPDTSGRYLIPELLSPREPDLGLDEVDALRFEYHYDILPEGLIPRFIVRTHDYLTSSPTYWRSGVLLQIDSNRVLVRGDTQEGKIFITVVGPRAGRRRALTAVRVAFGGIHNSIAGRGAEERVSLPGYPGDTVSYPHLLRLEKEGEETFIAEAVNERFDVQELLESIESAAQRSQDIADHQSEERPIKISVTPEVYVSYAWHEEGKTLCSQIEKSLESLPVRIRRDANDIGYKDSIINFMKDLGASRAVVAIFTDEYLKSKNCMFELIQILSAGDFRNRIFPIVAPSARLYESEDIIDYLLFWEAKRDSLDEKLGRLKGRAHIETLQADLTLYDQIRDLLPRLAHELRDMNTLTAEIHSESEFKELNEGLRRELEL